MNTNIQTVEEYIEQFEPKIQEILTDLRHAILKAAPNAEERIAWSTPTYYQNGFLVQFAAYKKHSKQETVFPCIKHQERKAFFIWNSQKI